MAVASRTCLLGTFGMHAVWVHACTCMVVDAFLFSCLQVYEVAFWLMKYGCPSPKRLLLRSSWKHIASLDLGKLRKKEKEAKTTIKTSCVGLGQVTKLQLCTYGVTIHLRSQRETLERDKSSKGYTVRILKT